MTLSQRQSNKMRKITARESLKPLISHCEKEIQTLDEQFETEFIKNEGHL